jgi:hypothetical protein
MGTMMRIGVAGWKALPPLLLTLALGGCFGLGGDKPPLSATSSPGAAPAEGEIDIRKFLGPDYCPEIRVRPDTESLRIFERGFEDDNSRVIWQASISETARECLYDTQGNLILRIGVSGRILSGPKGSPGTVQLPLRIAVVKHQEAVLSSELYNLAVTIPPEGSTVFTEVRELILPSPGRDRDYLIYLGFDATGESFRDIGPN